VNNVQKLKKIYTSWRGMHKRCYQVSQDSYPRYGGRGIVVCTRWHSFKAFCDDLEAAWFEGASINRINNDGNYEPTNCEWKPLRQNARPRKFSNEEIKCMALLADAGKTQREIAERFNTSQGQVSVYIKKFYHAPHF